MIQNMLGAYQGWDYSETHTASLEHTQGAETDHTQRHKIG